jgi:hypothetical protein
LFNLRSTDVVGATAVVVTKPGFGIVSNAIGAGARLVYTERGDFPEYPILVREIWAYLPVAHGSNDDLHAGHLRQAIEEVLARPFPSSVEPWPSGEGRRTAHRNDLDAVAFPLAESMLSGVSPVVAASSCRGHSILTQ